MPPDTELQASASPSECAGVISDGFLHPTRVQQVHQDSSKKMPESPQYGPYDKWEFLAHTRVREAGREI